MFSLRSVILPSIELIYLSFLVFYYERNFIILGLFQCTLFQDVSRLFLHLHHYVLRVYLFHYQLLVVYSHFRDSR
nr:MAG TPA: hypothetical protein [Bacteriophage sp.]